MNSVKYNNWRETVQNHQQTTPGFDKEAAWLKLNLPKTTRRKRTLFWLAAACFTSALFIATLLWNKKTNVPVPGMVKKTGNERQRNQRSIEAKGEKAPAQNQQQTVFSGKEDIEQPVVEQQPGISNAVKTPGQAQPVNPEPKNNLPEQTALAVTDTQAIKANIPVEVKTQNNTAVSVLKIVHINELSNQNTSIPVLAQEERKPSRIPFSKPAYSQYTAEQEPPPVQTERKRFGLLKTVASLKEN